MAPKNQNKKLSGARWAPQIIVLLDSDGVVLRVNRSLSGSDFGGVTEEGEQRLHEQLHPNCDRQCRFEELWQKAWKTVVSRESIEWEVDDPVLEKIFRMNLSLPPTVRPVDHEHRLRRSIVTITDITKYRREHERLKEREQKLTRLLREKGVEVTDAAPAANDAGDDPEITGERRSLAGLIIQAQEDERRRVAADLHDGIAQTLGVVKFQLDAGIDFLQKKYGDFDASIFDLAIEQIRTAVEELRRISRNLAPPMLDDFGLCVSLEWLSSQFDDEFNEVSVKCTSCIDEGEMPDVMKIAVYRIAQESLNNAVKHAQADQISISVQPVDGGISLLICDNGVGFDLHQRDRPAADGSGLGLRSMRERVESTGGVFRIESRSGEGTTIHANWPRENMSLLSDEAVLESVDSHSRNAV